jgi:hypothetical protein
LATTLNQENIGDDDSFVPLCVLLSDGSIQNQDVIDDSDVVDTIQSIALDIKVVCAFKKSYDDSFEGKRSPNLQQLRYLASGKKSHAMCCAATAINSKGAPRSDYCKNNKKCSKPPKKTKRGKKNQKERLLSDSSCVDSSETEFDAFLTSCMPREPCPEGVRCRKGPAFEPEETRCIMNAGNTEDVAACAVSRYIEDNLDPGSFRCSRYEEFDCANNEDMSFEGDSERCTDDRYEY